MNDYIIINEFTLARFLWACRRGRRPKVLATLPVISALNGVFSRLVAHKLSSGAAGDAFEDAPSLSHVRTFSVTELIYDVFAETEAWQREEFRFPAVEQHLSEYAMAYKLTSANYAADLQTPALLVDVLTRDKTASSNHIVGHSPALRGLFENYFQRPFPFGFRRLAALRIRFVNVVLAGLSTVLGLAWIVAHTRLRLPEATRCFLAVDDFGDGTNTHLLNDVTDGGTIVLVGRLKETPRSAGLVADHPRIYARDGRFNIGCAASAAWLVLRDIAQMLIRCGGVDCPVFWRAAQLPLRRIMIRALLSRIHPQFYWGRDPYSPDHSLRRQEMHRIGGQSHGLLHGFGALTNLYPMFRYIDYDRFYVFGRDIARLHRDSWAKDMSVVLAGTFGFSRDEIADIRAAEVRGRDVVVFTNVAAILHDDRFIAMVRALATALPERTILLQTKINVRSTPSALRFQDACKRNLPNVVLTEEPLADLIKRAACALSDPSTIVMETIQLGVPAFMADLLEGQKTCLYRKYSFLPLHTPDEAVQRIGSLLRGEWKFPFADCEDLINMTETTIFDHFRAGLGLPAAIPVASPSLAAENS